MLLINYKKFMKQKKYIYITSFVIVIIFLGIAVYFFNTKPKTQSIPASSSSNTGYLSICGIDVFVKNNQSIKTSTGNSGELTWGQLLVSDSMPDSNLAIYCTEKNKKPETDLDKDMNDVAYVLSIQSDGSSKVNKNSYGVFNKSTLSLIKDLYSAKNGGYRTGSETIGFSTEDWIYTFSFLNPEQNKNQNTFIVSVNP